VPSDTSRWSLWTPVVLYMALIFGLSSLSNTPQLPGGTDKDAHAILYFGLGVLIVRAVAGGWGRRVTMGMAVAAAIGCGLYGVSDEIHQHFVPPRQVEALDVVADTVGGSAAGIAMYLWSRRRQVS
jgi:VanZ family protein